MVPRRLLCRKTVNAQDAQSSTLENHSNMHSRSEHPELETTWSSLHYCHKNYCCTHYSCSPNAGSYFMLFISTTPDVTHFSHNASLRQLNTSLLQQISHLHSVIDTTHPFWFGTMTITCFLGNYSVFSQN
jgi:hypothetical protein